MDHKVLIFLKQYAFLKSTQRIISSLVINRNIVTAVCIHAIESNGLGQKQRLTSFLIFYEYYFQSEIQVGHFSNVFHILIYKEAQQAMAIFSARELVQLRELVSTGAETQVVLLFIDHLLQQLSRYDGQSDKIQQFTQELQKTKKMANQLQKENKILKQVVQNLKIDLEMKTIKNNKLVARLQGHENEKAPEERRELKKKEKQTRQVEIQCEILSLTMFDEIFELYQKSQSQKEDLRLLLTEALNNIKQRELREITAEQEEDEEVDREDLEYYYSDDESQVGQPAVPVREGQEGETQTSTPAVVADEPQRSSGNILGWLLTKSSQLIRILESQ